MDADAVRRAWEQREGAYSPRYYAYHGTNEVSKAIAETLRREGPTDPTVVELGCSAGRHLAHLYERGHRDLWGIDVNPESFAVMKESYPDLAEDGTFIVASIEDLIREIPTGTFDLVYSVETFQHIHHEHDWVFEEVARISRDLVITVEVEQGRAEGDGARDRSCVDGDFPLYYRDWGVVFESTGLVEVEAREFGRTTMRVFRRPDRR
ncbi:MAG: class I SAM-dependent methyltransferase [Halodesulfurarchaeum sp.]